MTNILDGHRDPTQETGEEVSHRQQGPEQKPVKILVSGPELFAVHPTCRSNIDKSVDL